VRTAYGGHEALEELSDDVDVILLDRRMPGLSGDEVLEEVRDFAALAPSGAYVGGDRRVSPKERAR
jgi:CheY-like chemotaxis protein